MENGALILNAIKELREYTRERFEGVEEQICKVNERLDTLNGKVAEHERRFLLQDGAAAEKARQRERSASASSDDSEEHRRSDLDRRGSAPQSGITARISVREAIMLLVILAAIATGNWDFITRWFR